MRFLRNLFLVFVVAFILNLVWENIHAPLYAHYKGGPITEIILLHATLVDALIITALAFFVLHMPSAWRRYAIMIVGGLGIAIGIEWWALATGRWAYTSAMPIVPGLGTGLTPTIQLAVLGFVSIWCVLRKKTPALQS